MTSFKFIHAADLHLDSPFKGLTHIPEHIFHNIQQSTFSAFDKIIDYCIEYKVDFLLLSGDIFDLEDRSVKAQMLFLKGLERLSGYGIKVYLIHGNHDPLSNQEKINFKWPDNVHSLSSEKVEECSFYKDNEVVARIYGRSYPNKALNENIVQEYSVRDSQVFNIGLLHTNVDGNKEHDAYAPTTLTELKSSAIDYWALGHIHKEKVLSEHSPAIVYSGNPQGRNIKETGNKGCFLVEINNSKLIVMEWLITSEIIWEKIEVNISKAETYDQLINLIENSLDEVINSYEKPIIVRVVLTGRTSMHFELHKEDKIEEILETLNKLYSEQSQWLLIESIKLNTKTLILMEEILDEDSFLSDFLKLMEECKKADIEVCDYREIGSELFNNRVIKKYLSELSADDIEEIYEQIKTISLEYLIEEGEA